VATKEEIMFRILITIIMALALLPCGVEAASTVYWAAGPNGTISNSAAKVTSITEPLLDWQMSLAVTATPNTGFQFRNFSGINFTKTTTNPVRVTDNGKDRYITANFTGSVGQVELITHGALQDVVDIKCGRSHTALLKRDGTVTIWGGNDGQSVRTIESIPGVSAVGVGLFNTFIVKDGTVQGYGVFADAAGVSNLPVTVPPLTNVVDVVGGWSHAVALKRDGTLEAWGTANNFGQISPLPNFGGLRVTSLAAGNNFTVALLEDGTVRTWGQDIRYSGGVLQQGPDPATLRNVVAISAKAWHALALLKDGTVVGWGYNDNRQPPAGLTDVKAIAAGGHHSVALKKDGTIVIWGDNSRGQSVIPAGIQGQITAIAAGYYYTMVQTPAAVVGWGENNSSQPYTPARAYFPTGNGRATCQTKGVGINYVDYGSSSVCTLEPYAGMKTFFAVNGVPRTLPEGSTTTTLTNITNFTSVTAVFGLPPQPPGIGAVSVANGQATVHIIPPADDGGAPITGYTVTTKTPTPGLGIDLDAGTTKLIHTVTGLAIGTQYTFAATAKNLLGSSNESHPSTSGGVTINDGAAFTRSPSVTLTLSANGVTQACVSNSATCTAWSAFSSTKPWVLSSGDGLKTVYVWFKDSFGNVSPQPYSAAITLDTSTPVNGTVSITPAAGAFTINWQGFSDTDIAGYRLVKGTAGYPLCSANPLYSGPALTYHDTDLVSGSTYYYRVCAVDAAGNTSTGATASQRAVGEYDPPTGSLAIIGGSGYAKSQTVSLALSASDASGVSQVCVSNSSTCTLWTPYTSTKSWTLTAGSGVKTVYAWFKDSLGNVNSEPYTASVTVDVTPPTNGTLAITPASGSFTLNWQGASDAVSGIALYRLVMSTTGYPLCSASPIYTGTGASFVHSGVVNGTTYYYRLCAVDNAGNTSAGATAMKKALAEYDAPVGSVAINNSGTYAKSPVVSLKLTATDATGVAQVCISNSASCTLWSSYLPTKTWTLLPGSGKKTVKAWFKDSLGNVSAPTSAEITLDTTPPTNGTLSITPAVGSFTLNWQGATDALSGIAGYKLVGGTLGYPACSAAPLYSGTGTSFVQNVTMGTTYYYRLCTVDNAGNSSTGATAMKKAVAEYDPPTGSVVINKGAGYTKSAAVTLSLSASDASGVSQVCVSNTTTCTLWSVFAATRSWTLPLGNGQKTVNVWFKDRLGNANTAPYTASIVLDTTRPTGTVSINDGAASTATRAVTLTLSATDNSGPVSSMQFSNDGIIWSAWENYAPAKDWTLSAALGTKRVLARFKDAAGNISAAAVDTITLTAAAL
jgi:hypothetical protein